MSTAGLSSFQAREGERQPYRDWDDVYRQQWQWDKVVWGSHCVDCYPGNCPFRVYVKDGVVLREEQAGTYGTIEEGVPDFNPMGCQKGAGWSQHLYGPERLLYPLRRIGRRGSGKWKRISWDDALTEIADAVLDAIQEQGSQSIIHETTPAQGGLLAVVAPARFNGLLGGTTLDLEGMINDFNIGQYITFGKFAVSSADDWFHSDLLLIWHMNPVYTRIPYYHFIAEARYKGAEVVTIAPDFSPSAVHADFHVPMRPGCDAALALAMCQVILAENRYDAAFIKDQTDLPLLVRLDNRCFLRQSDLEEGGRDDQFYFFDAGAGEHSPAPRGSLALGDVDPTLEGRFDVTLKDGHSVEVTPAFSLLREHLQDYTPELASPRCGAGPDVIRTLARKVASRRTNILTGFNVCKYYHGDLMERSLCLLLALTGNWGKQGAGIRSWSPGPLDGVFVSAAKRALGTDDARVVLQQRASLYALLKAQDPTLTEEMITLRLGQELTAGRENVVPSSFFLYYQAGYRERWNRRQWGDPTMLRDFDDYLGEALDRWWRPLVAPVQNSEPRVFIEVGGNVLRRTRGGQNMLLNHLWPKLKMVVTVDWRLSTTAMFSDIVLPAASHHEKLNLHYTTPHAMQLLIADEAAAPAGESKAEWEIFALLCRRLEERAKARSLEEYTDSRGNTRRLDNLYSQFTSEGAYEHTEELIEDWVADSAVAGNVPEGTSLQGLRDSGPVRLTSWGMSPLAIAQASDVYADKTHSPYRWHVENKVPYPTLTRRAQFYIDHPWFLEAGEAFPAHKENPTMGGDYPLELTSGHNRWSIHSQNTTGRILLQTHRARPHLVMNPADAAARGISDNEEARVYNDAGEFSVPVKLSPSVRPGQVICYNGWEPYMFRDWRDPANVEPGMVKWLHLAAGYGHLNYRGGCWQIITVDRATRVQAERAPA
ncbi:MAG: molybdopterin-dependent oxidoreductase [Chloroflexi bacterium]|nr:molybdopterin-dependent oxidoreductase [Chloroflexota bacterium]